MRMQVVQELTGRVLQIDGVWKAQEMGEEILRYNVLDGILSPEIQNIDEEVRCLYPIQSMISLREYFQKDNVDSEKLIGMLEQLIRRIQICEEYFLDEKNLLLHCEYMFWDDRRQMLFVAYLEGYQVGVSEGIARLLENFMDVMNHKDRELVFLVYGLHRFCKDPCFSLNGLCDFLKENRKKKESVIREKGTEVRRERNTLQNTEKSEEILKKKEDLVPSKLLAVFAVGIVLVFLVYQSGILYDSDTGEINLMRVAIVGILIVAVLGYVCWREHLSNEECAQKEKESNSEDATMLLADVNSDETVYLGKVESPEWIVNLIPKDWQRQEMKIRKSPYFIGKEMEHVDGIIEESDVSRIHAKIVQDELGVFIIDQESTNGTYVNGRQLLPWERCKMEDGDVIGISSVYYTAEVIAKK